MIKLTLTLPSVILLLYACSSSPPGQRLTAPSKAAAGFEPGRVEDRGNPVPVAAPATSTHLLMVAKSLLGLPYRYGGMSPSKGFDCSGFTYYTHRQIGIELPRTSWAQYRHTQPVSRQQLRPGDLVFFQTRRGRINHVGIYLGSDRFIHAPGRGKVVSVATLHDRYWRPRFARGGRIAL
ncbi:MAG: C40 family peptidase [Gammaproteobacteria bacterium]|nr:C40 family peptidase [Gammaproteobacteria bacterium]